MIRGIEEELRAHKYSHVERERRFLVDPARMPELDALACVLIEDRYVTGTRLRLRRMTEHSTGRVVMKLSKKYDVADVRARPLVTAYLTDGEYALLESLPARPLEKRRYAIGEEGFSIDVFSGPLAGLFLSEIEQSDEVSLASVKQPGWASAEVTDDPRYQGGQLAMLDEAGATRLIAG